MKRKKGYFSISAVAKMFSVHQQTIRLYEKEGLINPKRSTGNTRLFSEEDVDRLEHVIYLTHELGINLAGVEMVLKLQKQIEKLQKEINQAFASTTQALSKEQDLFKETAKQRAQQLVALKQDKKRPAPVAPEPEPAPKHEEKSPINVEPWEISYDE